tara:strand:+ start:42 stop:362 length:321 start_codon:yes stop_codon:yes gene_type:complete
MFIIILTVVCLSFILFNLAWAHITAFQAPQRTEFKDIKVEDWTAYLNRVDRARYEHEWGSPDRTILSNQKEFVLDARIHCDHHQAWQAERDGVKYKIRYYRNRRYG